MPSNPALRGRGPVPFAAPLRGLESGLDQMGISISEYCIAIIGCYSALLPDERESLHAWEAEHLDGSGRGLRRYASQLSLLGHFATASSNRAMSSHDVATR